MAGIVDKIGQYFSQLELEQQRAVALATLQAPAAAPPASTTANRSLAPASRRATLLSFSDAVNRLHSPSMTRQRLSLPSTAALPQLALDHETISRVKGLVVPPLAQSFHHVWGDTDSVGDDESDGLASWRSLEPPPRTSDRCSALAQDAVDKSLQEGEHAKRGSQRSVPRKKRTKKRKPLSPATLERLDAEKERERNERVADGLARAQERARRIQEETRQQAQATKLARQEAVERIKTQLERIEEVRNRQSALASVLSPCESSMSREIPSVASVVSSDGSECPSSRPNSSQASPPDPRMTVASFQPITKSGSQEQESHRKKELPPNRAIFLVELEERMRGQMLLQLQFRSKCLDVKKRHECLQRQVARTLEGNASKQARVESLEHAKEAAETQLSCILEEMGALRKQRHELEESGRNERLRRRKEAQRAFQRRLREEEWAKLMAEEKARSLVAAQAREKAGERVQKARWAGGKHLSSAGPGSLAPSRLVGRRGSADLEFLASLGPELAEFEEDGLHPSIDAAHGDIGAIREAERPANNQEEDASLLFEWLVPAYDARRDTRLLEVLSDDEDEWTDEADTITSACRTVERT